MQPFAGDCRVIK